MKKVAGTDEAGSGTVLSVGACLALVVSTWMICVLISWIGQAAGCSKAADLAALAAASAMAEGGEPCAAASRAAERNGAWLTSCEVLGDVEAFVVEVRVATELVAVGPVQPPVLERGASAGA